MRDLSELEIKPRRRATFGKLDETQVRAFQDHFRLTLPAHYLEFLRFQNGGYPRLRYYADPAGGDSEVNDFYGLGTSEADAEARAKHPDSWDVGNLWGETRIWRPWIGEVSIPIGRDGGNNQVLLETSTSPAKVSKLSASTRKTRLIADSLAGFLDMLRGSVRE
jgi:hypothetical protein